MSNHELSSNSSKQPNSASGPAPAQSRDADGSTKRNQRSVRIAQLVWALIYISWTAYLIYVAVQIQKQ